MNKIKELAYDLWEKAGRPEGQAEKFWLEAESVMKRSESKSFSKKVIIPLIRTISKKMNYK